MKAAVYLRVSTDRQTIENQRPEVLAMCSHHGWIPVLFEEVESGAKARPVWDSVLAAARSGQVGAVVAWSLDRMGRTMYGILDAIRELDARGVRVVTIMEPWLFELGSSPALRSLMISILAFAAEVERTRTIEKIHRGISTARRRNVQLGRPRVIHGEALALATRLRVEKKTWTQIARALNDAGYRRTDGRMFARGSIQTAVHQVLGGLGHAIEAFQGGPSSATLATLSRHLDPLDSQVIGQPIHKRSTKYPFPKG